MDFLAIKTGKEKEHVATDKAIERECIRCDRLSTILFV
jgi:hypothetical protein